MAASKPEIPVYLLLNERNYFWVTTAAYKLVLDGAFNNNA